MTTHRFFPHRPIIPGLVVLLPALLLESCGGEPPVLTIGEVEYTESELLTYNADARTALAELTAFGLAVSRGETAPLGAPLVQRRAREALLEALERELALEFAGVEEGALEARYQADPDYELRVRHLVVLVAEWASEEEEAEARRKAERALERIRSGEDFARVAGEVSEEPEAQERGGLLQPGREGTWVPEFWNAASTLPEGGVSPVIRTPYGYHVLKLEERTPLPFSQRRHRVVEEVALLIPPQEQTLQRWVDSVTAPMEVDSRPLMEAWEETGTLLLFKDHPLLGENPATVLVRWPGGAFHGHELRQFLITLKRPEWEQVDQEGVPEVVQVLSEAARGSLLASLAREKGISPPPGEEESFRQDWKTSVGTWAQVLGFQEGMDAEEVKTRAMAGVGASGQGARIARQELHGWGPLLLSAYPIGPKD